MNEQEYEEEYENVEKYENAVDQETNRVIDVINCSSNILFAVITAHKFCISHFRQAKQNIKQLGHHDRYNHIDYYQNAPPIQNIIETLISTKNMSTPEFDIEYYVYWDLLLLTTKHLNEVINLSPDLTDNARFMLEVIGNTGEFERPRICDNFLDIGKERGILDQNATIGTAQRPMEQLVATGLVVKTDIEHPFKSNYSIYTLTDSGISEYKKLIGKEPIEPLIGRTIKDHATIEHWLGVSLLEQICIDSKEYYFVSSRRSDCSFNVNGQTYIADIICRGSSPGNHKFTKLYEYERNTHTQVAFEAKLNKAMHVRSITGDEISRILIVTNNYDNAYALMEKCTIWAEKKGLIRLEKVEIWITTLTCLRDALLQEKLLSNKKFWRYVSDFRHGMKWFKNNPKITYNAVKRTQP